MATRRSRFLQCLALLSASPWGIPPAIAEEDLPPASLAPQPAALSAEANQFVPPLIPPPVPLSPTDYGTGPLAVEAPANGVDECPPEVCPPCPKWWQFWRRKHQPAIDCHGPRPLGASLFAAMSAQVANGEAEQMILYHYDFRPGTSRLNAPGLAKLAKINRRLLCNAFPIVLQSTGDPDLDGARRERVLQELAALPVPVPPERVLIGTPSDRGLDGVDAILIERRLQGLTNGALLGPGVPPAAPLGGVPPQR